MWAYFKKEWRTWLCDTKFHVNRHNLDEKLVNCLNTVAHHGQSLAKGPLKHILSANAPHWEVS